MNRVTQKKLNIFYQEPDNDRWFRFDRYPRKILRFLMKKPQPIGGVKKWYLNLIQGLDKINSPYTINDYRSLKFKGSDQWALVIGKPHVIDKIPDYVNIIYGPAVASHPSESAFLSKKNIKHILISSNWFKNMYDRDLSDKIPTSVWASGIETDLWKPDPKRSFNNSILVYDKIRWRRDHFTHHLLDPILKKLAEEGIQINYLRYGSYIEDDFKKILQKVDGMVFLCEHETQGFAYLQALSSNVPIIAWDRGGDWQDPMFYPSKVKFGPVTSVPYWDDSCGVKFKEAPDFKESFDIFWRRVYEGTYNPRKYILENLTLEECATSYVETVNRIMKEKS